MLPGRHPARRRFVESGFFSGLSSVSDLELRIAGLPTEKERGAAFEVFAEAYLATQRIAEAREVWPLDIVPIGLRRRLRLDTKDMGVDGVLETHLGEIAAYQVKFRSGRPTLTWTELATFFGLTDYPARRLLFTNCHVLPPPARKRSRFFAIMGSDLDRLESLDFEAISGWLRGSIIPTTKKAPRPHQTEAIDAILGALRRHNRVTAVMPCGTGKTLVQLWIAERMKCHLVLVLVPSLALLRQSLHEWLKETRWQAVAYLGVCSDPSVERGLDEIVVQQSDLDFPITTDSEAVHKFVSRGFRGVKIVFCTYHSASVVARGLPSRTTFDLAIFDEAHQTAGRPGSRNSSALNEKHLSSRKRLFMTATPRHYDIHRRDQEDDATLIYSMDRPDVYGPVAYKLSFAESVRQGIIVDYKVLISVVTSRMVTEEQLRRGEVIVQGDTVKAPQVANQIALAKAVEQYDIHKIITFHRRVRSAASFTAVDGQGFQSHLQDCESFHVNGQMPTAERESRMRAFRDAYRAVMSNARCLTEGVDVPTVDMVAFLSPKRSRVDIVQATGRAMRTAPGKATGYVFLPLLLPEATAAGVDEAVRRSVFEEIWTLLQAMQEQDEPLAEIIREMRETRGRTKGFDDRRFREKVVILGPEVSLEALRTAITTVCIEKLGVTWDERYGQLQAFKEKHGHCWLPTTWSENPKLATWVSVQRRERVRLSKARIEKLERLGFVWYPFDQAWEEMHAALSQYKSEHGHCNVPLRWPMNRKLAVWVMQQRVARRQGRLSEERIKRLDEVGLVWDMPDKKWEEMFSALAAYKAQHGGCDVLKRWPENQPLATWVQTQRDLGRKGQLTKERRARLEALGFNWKPFDNAWERMFAALVRYKKAHGDCDVPHRWPENQELGVWVGRQGRGRRDGRLSSERIRKLESLGFTWERADTSWNQKYRALCDYRKEHGHCNVPQRWPEDQRLATWVAEQRKHRERLSPKRIVKLEKIGFIWNAPEANWEEMFSALVDYKKRYGHCNVPQDWPANPKLGRWIGTQRQEHKNHLLDEERVRRLGEIRFEWVQVSGRKRRVGVAVRDGRSGHSC